MADDVVIYTDGAASNTLKVGGWAFILDLGGNPDTIVLRGAHLAHATSNQAELIAGLAALKFVLTGCQDVKCVQVYSDSQYFVNGITTWVPDWKHNGWVTAAGQLVKNKYLWVNLDKCVSKLKKQHIKVEFNWIPRGTRRGNILADVYAKAWAAELIQDNVVDFWGLDGIEAEAEVLKAKLGSALF